MANKDHSLDDKIISSAKQEFLQNGFEKASLRKIAKDADVTIGAIYTRYPTKDNLFCSLCEPLIDKINLAFSSLTIEYFADKNNLQLFHKAMQMENDAILHILFDDYDRAKLLLCNSKGSSLDNFLDLIVDKKIDITLKFFEQANIKKIDNNVIKIIIESQFYMYCQIINGGYKLDEAKLIMKNTMKYHEGGWEALVSHK